MDVNLVLGPENIPDGRRSKAEERELYRSERLKDHLHTLFTCFIYVAFVFLLIVFSVRLVHLIVPATWYWLNGDQIQNIDRVFFSGAIGGVLGGYFKGKLNKHS